jgi:hypothetical protein
MACLFAVPTRISTRQWTLITCLVVAAAATDGYLGTTRVLPIAQVLGLVLVAIFSSAGA